MIPPVNSLVKYDSPVLVSSTKDKDKACYQPHLRLSAGWGGRGGRGERSVLWPRLPVIQNKKEKPFFLYCVAPLQDAKGSKGKKLAPVDKPQLTQTEDILNSILPPRCARAHCSGCVRLLRPGAALFYEAAAEAFCPSSPLHATGAVARDPEAPFSFVAGRDRR